MSKIAAMTMTVVGVGLMVWAGSDFVPSGDYGGWSESCRYVMTAGAMLATGGRLLSKPDRQSPAISRALPLIELASRT